MYIYTDEDNAPMNDFDQDGHNPTVYGSRAEMKWIESGKHQEEKPADGCWNCMNFDWKHEACTLLWNNLDDSYYNSDIDDRELTDHCDEWEENPDVDPADCFDFGGNEP